jgi:hypothetical protein
MLSKNGTPSLPQRRSIAHGAWRLLRLSAVLCVVVAATACSEESEERTTAGTAPQAPVAIYELTHLGVTDHIPPEQWLASRQAGRDLPEDDPSVAAFKRALETAGRRFRDYPRMIANRAVQLEEMLQEKNLAEPAPQLIARLSEVPGETRSVESFGALCQHYYNLRMQGLDQHEALEILKHGGDTSN